MFILDDIILRSLGVSIPPFDLIWILELINDLAYKEMYNPKKIKAQIKENRMLFELGELTKKEYEEINEKLVHNLRLGERVRELDLDRKINIL